MHKPEHRIIRYLHQFAYVSIIPSLSRCVRVYVCAPSNFTRIKWPSRDWITIVELWTSMQNGKRNAGEKKRNSQVRRQADGKSVQNRRYILRKWFSPSLVFDSSTMMDGYDGWFITSSENPGRLQTLLAWVIIRQIMVWFWGETRDENLSPFVAHHWTESLEYLIRDFAAYTGCI